MIQKVPFERVFQLLEHPDEELQTLGLELLGSAAGLESAPLESWNRLLESKNLDVLEAVCAMMAKLVSPQQFATDRLLMFATGPLGQQWTSTVPSLLIFCGNNRRQRLVHALRDKPFANDHLDAFFPGHVAGPDVLACGHATPRPNSPCRRASNTNSPRCRTATPGADPPRP